MIPSKFKAGDAVTTSSGIIFRISKSVYLNKSWTYVVEIIDNPGFSSPPLTYCESDLKFHYDMPKGSENYVPRDIICPKCNSPWLITGFGRKKYYDCPTCKRKAEDLEKPQSSSGFNTYWS